MLQPEYRNINEITKLSNNPRVIKDKQFKTLCDSIEKNKDYFEARPIILSDRTGELVIIAGNQRYEAAKHLGLTEVPTVLIPDLDEDKEREIIIRDNVANGEWDFEMLANEWDSELLTGWGLDIPSFDGIDYSDKNKEIDIDELDSEMVIKLKYTEEEYHLVKGQLSKIAATPEEAVWQLLGNK